MLTVIIAEASPARFALGAQLALAEAALGRSGLFYLHDGAVPLAREPLIEEMLAAGVRVIVCQTGLAAAGLVFADLPRGIEAGGLVSLLAEAAEARLVVV